MANTGSLGCLREVETFDRDDINSSAADGVRWLTSADGGDTAFARAASAALGRHAAGATAATDDNMIELNGDILDVYGQVGAHALEVLFRVDVATNIAFNIGFNDDSLEASNTLPAELATATWTSNASTFVGLVFDTDATNADVHCFWVDADADTSKALADLRMSGATLAAAVWAKARVEIQDRGSGNGVRATFSFSQNGKTFEKVFDTSVTRSTALVPYIGFENRSASAHNCYVKYIITEQSISD